MSVSYKGLKSVLCVQKLGSFGYTPLLVSLKIFSSLPLYVCVKILSILQKKKKSKKSQLFY